MLWLLACTDAPPPPEPPPAPAVHLDAQLGEVKRVKRGKATVEAVSAAVPSELTVTVTVPPEGRVDVALGGEGGIVTFRLFADHELLFVETVEGWTQGHADLSHRAGQEVTLRFEATSAAPEAQAHWGAPMLSGTPVDQPNVLLYVIDGGGADLMSLYGYERPTTDKLKGLAAEGVVFTNAHTNSAWTKPSTASFLTSLHHSVLGGFTKNEDVIPDAAVTMGQHFDRAGYPTAVFTTNPFAGSMSGLQRDIDVFRDHGAVLNSTSSVELHQDFLTWRDDWPAQPWWVHLQTTDVHEPHKPVEPYAGLYTTPERREQFNGWWDALHKVPIEKDTVLGRYQARLGHIGVDPRLFFRTQWDLYDETMTHNDSTLEDLVAALKARGEWDNTVLIVTADHGHPAGSFSRFGRGLLDPQPAAWEGALADSYRTHVPLVVFWPDQLEGGQVIDQHVSLVDLLPTVLELAGLPPAEVQQGRSLVPLLKGQEMEPTPVVLEQVQAYEDGQMVGHIELIDGQWAASLEILPASLEDHYVTVDTLITAGGWRAARPHRPTTPRLLLYDLENDPFCTTNVNAEHPEKVEQYTRQLTALWDENVVLAEVFGGGGVGEAGPEQLEALRVLGYIE